MSLEQTVTNTWTCDGFECPTSPVVAEANPFHTVHVTKPALPHSPGVSIDLCDVCIATITAPDVVAYVASSPE
jgi:hypothetical protein